MSGSIRLIQRKLIQIDSNLRRHCSIREILSSKYTFRWREFARCHGVNQLLPVEGVRETTGGSGRVQMTAALLQLGHLCLEALSADVQEVIP